MGNTYSRMLKSTETGTWTTGGQQQAYKKAQTRQYNSTKQDKNT